MFKTSDKNPFEKSLEKFQTALNPTDATPRAKEIFKAYTDYASEIANYYVNANKARRRYYWMFILSIVCTFAVGSSITLLVTLKAEDSELKALQALNSLLTQYDPPEATPAKIVNASQQPSLQDEGNPEEARKSPPLLPEKADAKPQQTVSVSTQTTKNNFLFLSNAIESTNRQDNFELLTNKNGIILLALSGGLFWMMKFCGLPGSWIRVNATKSSLENTIIQNTIAFAKLCDIKEETRLSNNGPSRFTIELYDLLDRFHLDISDIVADETEEWAKQLRESVANLKTAIQRSKETAEKNARNSEKAADSNKPGQILLALQNWSSNLHRVLEIYVDDELHCTATSDQINLSRIPSGEKLICLKWPAVGNTNDGQQLTTIKVKVNPGEITEAQLTIP